MKQRDLRWLMVLGWVLNSMMGCGSDPVAAPPPRAIKHQNSTRTPKAKAQTIATDSAAYGDWTPIERFEPVSFLMARNPFVGFVDDRLKMLREEERRRKAAQAKKSETELRPLQKFELHQLKLAMTITNQATPMAIFYDPTGKRYYVYNGDPIGPDGGYVSNIREDEVKVIIDPSLQGGWNDGGAPRQKICVLLRLNPPVDALIQATRQREGKESQEDPCEVIRYYPPNLENIELGEQ